MKKIPDAASHLEEVESSRNLGPSLVFDVPELIGDYRLLNLLGEGGMGQVYLAEQQEPMPRQVAIKVTRQHWRSESLRMRFEVERRALARMSHPNIAQVFEAGELEDGRPYFVMEYVPGVQLDEYCNINRLAVAARLELFLQVCAGIHHAHQKGVLHRDIKPSNVLVCDEDGKPVVKILDFGIAKELDAPVATHQLTIGVLLGTPAFASPEAAVHAPGKDHEPLDIRSDVYGLGVLLYLLLVGALPHGGSSETTLLEYLERVAHQDPLVPSTFLGKVPAVQLAELAVQRATTASGLRHRLRGDLDCIAAKALARERDRRYGSAAEFAEDVRRFLAFEPVQARPPGRLYLLRRAVRRNRVVVAATALLLAALVGSLLARGHQVHKASLAQAEAQAATDFLLSIFADAGSPGAAGGEVTLRQVLDYGSRRLESHFVDKPEIRARLAGTMGEVYIRLGDYQLALQLLEEAEDLQGRLGVESPVQHGRRLCNMAIVQLGLGRFEEAEVHMQRALRVHEAYLPEGHEDLLKLKLRLALFQVYVDQMPEAIAHFERLLEQLRDRPGLDLLRSDVLSGLGMAYLRTGRMQDAERLLEESLVLQEALLGPEHLESVQTLDGLARVYGEAGKVERAEALHRRVLLIQQRSLGSDHPELAHAHNNFGVFLWLQRRLPEALRQFERALIIHQKHFGSNHPSVAASLGSLSEVERELGNLQQAIAYAEEALDILYRQDATEPTVIRKYLEDLVKLYRLVGDAESLTLIEAQLAALPARAEGKSLPGHTFVTQTAGEAAQHE